ncbi:hypothetical protein COY23_03455 [bacterium (Candidatus Torokbacteria) CG_4_10_14_0_2_um_filter_35_8]|nr:MAG: hypothetical protein COY23_03455 [bacterium (Candidatus Torokbacteria) CG_4_10_14_0_2_um_filter_35_8]
MSFVITTYVPEALVMASDSRQSVKLERKNEETGEKLPVVETVSSDFVYKTFLLEKQKVGVSSYGDALLGGVNTESHIKRFAEEKLEDNDDVTSISEKLLEFFKEKFPKANTAFHVSGFKKEGKKSIPYVYVCHIAKNERNRVNVKPDEKEKIIYGSAWGGQGDVMASILNPGKAMGPDGKVHDVFKTPILWDAMTVQDTIDFTIYAVRTTIDTMRFQARPKNVGGPIDVLLITSKEAKWIQRKELHGEMSSGLGANF